MLNWLADIPKTQPIAQGVIVLCLVAASGLALGSIRLRGFSLGIAGTLFAGLFFAHFGFNVDPSCRAFIQEFGLVLFVYTIGLQVGPGFAASLRRQGLSLNLLAAGVVLLGVAVTVALCGGAAPGHRPHPDSGPCSFGRLTLPDPHDDRTAFWPGRTHRMSRGACGNAHPPEHLE